MIGYSELEIQGMCVDWCAYDKNDEIGFFTSGGGQIPSCVRNNRLYNEICSGYFMNNCFGETGYSIHPTLILDDFVKKNESSFLSWAELASNGTYHYEDYKSDNEFDPTYYCIGIPESPLKLSSLPDLIKDAVMMIKFQGIFKETFKVRNDLFV